MVGDVMRTILVTNDDGVDSPTLVPFARALERLGRVRVVVPDSERSWIGKAISRFDVLQAAMTARDGYPMHAVSGTPADCASLGIHTLFDGPPDVVVSGINLGLNYGGAFVLSSGTVGGAIEGWIAGLPAVAFSMAIPNDAYGLTGAARNEALGERPVAAADVAVDILETMLAGGYPEHVDVFSVNMPADVGPGTPRVVTRVARSRYGPLFEPGPDGGYIHRFRWLTALDNDHEGDIQVLRRGAVGITPMRFDFGADLSADLRAALERRR